MVTHAIGAHTMSSIKEVGISLGPGLSFSFTLAIDNSVSKIASGVRGITYTIGAQTIYSIMVEGLGLSFSFTLAIDNSVSKIASGVRMVTYTIGSHTISSVTEVGISLGLSFRL